MATRDRGSQPVPGPSDAQVTQLRDAIAAQHGPIVVVGLDGRSGSGKSTLATALATALTDTDPGSVTVIEGDQFYAGGSAETWDARTPTQNADRVIDWRRQRDVLDELREHGAAHWHPFDWDSEDWASDSIPFAPELVIATTPVIVLEGAYSCRPELHDLLDLRVLLAVPAEVRARQLLEREGDERRSEWDARWAAAEDHYFGNVMTADRFDLVLAPPPGT